MPSLEYNGVVCGLAENETVLDALLRSGIRAAHSCKAGSCGSCMLRAEPGTVPPEAQRGLKDTWKAQGYFLACQCRPAHDLVIATAGADAHLPATIAALDLLSPDVLRLRLRAEMPPDFHAGQYVTLLRENGLARSYSIASLPGESELELHVRRIPGGSMSGWLHDHARPGDTLKLIGPAGACFYVQGREDQPLLLAGTGTGLAPLYGIVRDALAKGHKGPIHLFHGALNAAGLYLVSELRRLAAENLQFEYTPATLSDDGPIDQVILKRFPKLTGWRGYICGDPSIVESLKRKFFLAGMASREICADAFLPSVL